MHTCYFIQIVLAILDSLRKDLTTLFFIGIKSFLALFTVITFVGKHKTLFYDEIFSSHTFVILYVKLRFTLDAIKGSVHDIRSVLVLNTFLDIRDFDAILKRVNTKY